MHAQILLDVPWCAMSIFLVLKFYNFIKGIMRIDSIFKKRKTNVLRPQWGPVRKFLGSKEHLNWLKIDLNAAEIITIQDYKHAQN